MKSLILSLLLPLVVSSAVLIPRVPQTSPSTAAPKSPFSGLSNLIKGKNGTAATAAIIGALSNAKLAKVEHVKAELRPGAKRVIARYGPYVLAGKGERKVSTSLISSLDPNGQAFIELLGEGLCSNCTVLLGRTKLTFEDGSDAGPTQGVYVHHIISRDLSKPINLPISKCGVGQTSSRVSLGSEFLAQGDDSVGSPGGILFTSADGKFESGFFLGANHKIMSQVDLVNYNASPQKVYVNYEIEYVDGKVGLDSAAVLMSVTGCADMLIPNQEAHEHGGPPPASLIQLNKTGIAVTKSPKFPISRDAKIVAALGHMHDGGSKMILFINDKEVCSSNAVYDKGGDNNEETIHHMSKCDSNIPVKKGDVVTLNGVYDLKTHPLRAGAEHNTMGKADVMAMFYLTFAIDDAKKS